MTSATTDIPRLTRTGRRRLRAAGAALLLVGAVAGSAAPAWSAPALTRAGGGWAGSSPFSPSPSASSVTSPYASPYASSYASVAGSGVVSSAATSAQSAGVVLIDTVLPYQDAQAAGTGMVLTADGQVLTNYHVVQGAGTISVTVAATGTTYPATVVGTDPSQDVALLQLTGASGLTTVKADDDVAAVGDAVTAVGNAGGTGTLTAAPGTISSLTSTVTAQSEGTAGGSETLTAMIETSADVVAGDSGGPLFDAEGEVVGIDTAASTGGQIDGYAIPIARALGIVDQIRSGTETSTVRVGPAAFLGVELSSGASASAYGSGSGYGYGSAYGSGTRSSRYAAGAAATGGSTVSGVVSGGPAAGAGLAAGDVITAIGGTTVTSAADVSTALATTNPGDQVTVTWTDAAGASHTGTVTLGSSPVA